MNKKDFLNQLESRLEENRGLAKGGLPGRLAPVVSLVGMHTWQVLVFGGFILTSLGFLLAPVEFLRLVRIVLLMG